MQVESPQKQEKFCRTYDLTKAQPSTIKPFAHQTAALGKLHQWSGSKVTESGGILVLPTGGGKTFTAWRFLCSSVLSEGYKVLWLAHTHHLLEQAFYGLESEVGQIAKTRRQLTVRVVSGTIGHFRPAHIQPDDDILICTLQTITRASKESNKQFEALLKSAGNKLFVVFDEAHHSPAPSYCRLIDTLRKRSKEMRLLGLTATPTYTDKAKAGWLRKLFPQGIIYQTTADKLIADNILAKPIFEQAPTFIEPEFDEQKYKDWVRDYRDLPEEIITKLAENQQRNAFIASTYARNRAKFGKTIIFADRWFQCDYLREALLKHEVKAEVIYSHTDADPGSADARNKRTEDDNKQAIRKFRNNEIDVLINVRMLTEGTDIPDVNTVFLTRQTTSKILLTQMVGRALRGRAAGGTDQAYIVSFVDDWHHAIDWAEYDLEDGGTADEPINPAEKPPIHLVSIELVRQLARQMDSGININAEPFLKLMPIGWYRIAIDTQAEGSGDTEVVQRLVMVFEQEKAGYENFINFLREVEAKELEPFVEPDVHFDRVREKLEDLQDGFFASTLHIGGDLLTSLFYIVRHIAQNDREAPDWFEFEQRDEHDLDRFTEKMMTISMSEDEKDIRLSEEYKREDRYWSAIYPNYDFFWSQYNACVGYILSKRRGAGQGGHWKETSPPASEPTEEIKQAVKLRDRYRCLCCGLTERLVERLQVDHIDPKYHGGDHEETNLQTLCKDCNRLKGLEKISFVTSRSSLDKMPPDFPTLPLPHARDIEQWRRFLYRSINFFYQAAAVESVTLGQHTEAWGVKLHPGNEPSWLRIYLEALQQRIQAHRALFKLPCPRHIVIKAPTVTLLPRR